MTPSLRLLPSAGLRVFADLSMVKKLQQEQEHPPSLGYGAASEQEQEYEYEFARTLGTGFGSFVSIRVPRRSGAKAGVHSPAAP
jgi:hypothetical protein